MAAKTGDRYVLDSFALLVHLLDEPAADRMADLLDGATRGTNALWLCVINLGEVLYITERGRGIASARLVAGAIDQLPVRIVDADRRLTHAAAHLKANHPISYADAFAAALAIDVGAALVTGDPEFRALEGVVDVEWLT